MAALFVAVNVVAADVFGTGAEKRIGRRNDVFFECHGAGHKLKGRTGFVNLGDDLIFPKAFQKLFVIGVLFVLCADKSV